MRDGSPRSHGAAASRLRLVALVVAITAVKLSDGLSGPALWIVLLAGMLFAAALARRAAWSTKRWDDHLVFRSEANRRVLRANAGARWRPPFG
jgi:hypothetical protein